MERAHEANPRLEIAQRNLDAARALLETLAQAGLCAVVCSPGSRSTPLTLTGAALEAEGALELYMILDERAAAFFALGLALRRQLPVALVCTSGSAPAHYLPALIEAKEAGVSLLVLSADRPASLRESGALQCTDQRAIFSAVLPYQESLERPDPTRWALVAQRAWRAITASPAQPGQLNLHFPEPLWPGEVTRADALAPSALVTRSAALERARPRWLIALPPAVFVAAEQLSAQEREARDDALFDCLARTSSGLIRCGPLQRDALSAPRLAALARCLEWPVIAEAASGLRADPALEEVELRCGGLLVEEGALEAPEATLELGAAHHSRALRAWLRGHVGPRLLASDRRAVANPDLCPALELSDSPAQLVEGLIAAGERAVAKGWRPPQSATARLERWRSLDQARCQRLSAQLEGAEASGAQSSDRVAATVIEEVVAHDAALQVSSSLPFRAIDRVLTTPLPQLYSHRGVNGIDGQIASSCGLALAHAPKVTLLWSGDLSFLHDQGALSLLQRHRPPLVILVSENGGGGIFRLLPIAQHALFERLFFTPHALSLEAFGEVAQSKVEALEAGASLRPALAAALQRAAAGEGPQLLSVPIDPAEDEQAWRALTRTSAPLPT